MLTVHRVFFVFCFVLGGTYGCGGSVEDDVGFESASLRSKMPNPDITGQTKDPTGRLASVSTQKINGKVDETNPFFLAIGINGRTCSTCHQAAEGWSVSPAGVQSRFDATNPAGTDAIFRTVDGSNSPRADVSTPEKRRIAYSMLLNKGLIRVGLPIPAGAEFTLQAVDDPYGFASTAELSLFRRPLPSTNLVFLSGVMWDGRESGQGRTIEQDLRVQANGATLGHAEAGKNLTDQQRSDIVNFELSLFTAQIFDDVAGVLHAAQATGGPGDLAGQEFYLGINDSLGGDPQGRPFDPRAFNTFDAWRTVSQPDRRAVTRGQDLFNTRTFTISGVRGVNDVLGVPALTGTCTTCHDSPNVGNHSLSLPLDLGLTDPSRRTPDMPLYTLRNNATGELRRTTDPGRALITGRWDHIALFKGPILRGLAARPPYFHNGFAPTLAAVVNFYDQRFSMGLSAAEKSDLVAFLRSL